MFDGILQLAHIAGPAIIHQAMEDFITQGFDGLARVLIKTSHERLDEELQKDLRKNHPGRILHC